ncbi:hypothetical protein L249_6626 [Ophiocordyceps polyrhachis-furcata BCC 54312]|uniref:WW domain-containing protein n=1 Tax=Ophiocordyceps polyrhachis-furcata BCC 54312 TaxID=1330021 RepID=A0A367LJL1_9HYPO|nr:hypothetical protein L249_6626 [Ophiocordyceps polyrhachis-furcata BCC 54312]
MSSSHASPADASNSPKPSDDVAVEHERDATPAAEGASSPRDSTLAKDESEANAIPDDAATDGHPPLPDEPVPQQADDGWSCKWDHAAQTWLFSNRFTGVSQWQNPRVPVDGANAAASTGPPFEPQPSVPTNERPAAGGYNPAIHGDYDPNAWYAQVYNQDQEQQQQQQQALVGVAPFVDPAAAYGVSAGFNRFTGQFQAPGVGPQRHSDEAKARRQMNAFFDVDAAANAHDGRSLKAERQNQKLSKSELKAYKEKRRAKKEEKRRAWLMD